MVEMEHDDHGASPAAWTGVAIITLASLLMCMSVIWASTLWFVVGLVLVVVGVLVGKAMAAAGKGVAARRASAQG